MVFCRETGANEEEEDVDAREGVCSIAATDMFAMCFRRRYIRLVRYRLGYAGFL